MTIRASKPHANEADKAPPALVALVRLLARQAALEALAETNSHHEQNKGLSLNLSGEEDAA